MEKYQFSKEIYPKISLLKAAYNFTDKAYLHLDADEKNYYVTLEPKHASESVTLNDFTNELLAQTVRHEIYQETKNIRELLLARAMATTVIADSTLTETGSDEEHFTENDIIQDWFEAHDQALS